MAILVNTQIRDDLYATGSIEAAGGFTGSVWGTSSFAVSASYALSASYAANSSGPGGGGLETGSTYPFTSSWALTASYISGPFGHVATASFAYWADTASYALNAESASYFGTGNANYYPVWRLGSTLVNTSSIYNHGGNVGIGTLTATNTKLYVYNTNTVTTTGNVIGSRVYQASSVAGNHVIHGIYVESAGVGAASSGTSFSGTLYGIYCVSSYSGQAVTASNMVGEYLSITQDGDLTGTAKTLVLNVNNTGIGSGFGIASAYLLFLEAMTGSSDIITRYGIYQAGTEQNYLGGHLGVGVAPTTVNDISAFNISASVITASIFRGTASFAVSASWAPGGGPGGGGLETGSTYPFTASWAVNAVNGISGSSGATDIIMVQMFI